MDDRPSFLGTYLTPIAPLFMRDDLLEVAINPDGKVWIERKGATHMERVAHLSIDRVLSTNLGQAIASAVLARVGCSPADGTAARGSRVRGLLARMWTRADTEFRLISERMFVRQCAPALGKSAPAR